MSLLPVSHYDDSRHINGGLDSTAVLECQGWFPRNSQGHGTPFCGKRDPYFPISLRIQKWEWYGNSAQADSAVRVKVSSRNIGGVLNLYI